MSQKRAERTIPRPGDSRQPSDTEPPCRTFSGQSPRIPLQADGTAQARGLQQGGIRCRAVYSPGPALRPLSASRQAGSHHRGRRARPVLQADGPGSALSRPGYRSDAGPDSGLPGTSRLRHPVVRKPVQCARRQTGIRSPHPPLLRGRRQHRHDSGHAPAETQERSEGLVFPTPAQGHSNPSGTA